MPPPSLPSVRNGLSAPTHPPRRSHRCPSQRRRRTQEIVHLPAHCPARRHWRGGGSPRWLRVSAIGRTPIAGEELRCRERRDMIGHTTMTTHLTCWCGNAALAAFCPGYARCPVCDTLVSSQMPGPDIARVDDEERDFYGRHYWFAYQEEHRGNLPLSARTRSDLPERCLHWLRTLLAYKFPPARVLELGSAHGGFVGMLRLAGFDAIGLEISPWVVEFARATFEVPMLLGPLEAQDLDAASFDVIALMDVLEHLPDPTRTMQRCL